MFCKLVERHLQKLSKIQEFPKFLLQLYFQPYSLTNKLLHVLDLWGLGQRMEKLFTKAWKYLITGGRGQLCFN